MVYPITRLTLFPSVRFFIKKTEGLENLPEKGPYLIACKHLGPLDGVFIASVIVPRINQKIAFVANISRWGWFWEKVVSEKWGNCVPFYKENPQICLEIARDKLRKGEVVGIFPEGIIQDYDSKKHRAKTGAARLAIWSKVPIVPIGLEHDITIPVGMPRLLKRRQVIKNILLNPHSLEIHIGKPFEISEYYDKEQTKESLTEATNYIMDKIDELTKVNYNKQLG